MEKPSWRMGIVLALLALAPCAFLAQTAGQGIMLGEWKLNVAKSQFGTGLKLREMAVKVVSDTPDLIQYSVDMTTESGFAVSYSFKGPADGKEYQLTGSAELYRSMVLLV